MFRVNILSYIFCIFFSLLCILFIIPTQTPPYPGFGVPSSYMPNAMCGVILVLSCLGLVNTLWKKTGQGKSFGITLKMFLHFLLFMIPILASMPLMIRLGYIPGAFITIAGFQLCAGEKRIVYIIAISGLGAVLTYLGLWYGLQVPMPS